MRTLIKTTAVAIIVTASTLTSGAAVAQQPVREIFFQPFLNDAKVHAGSFCQALVGKQVGNLNTVSWGIVNIGPYLTTVTCPVLRDNTLNTNGTFGVSVRVNNPLHQRLSCSLFSIGTHTQSVVANTASTSTVGNQTINLNVNRSSSTGQYSIICNLPPKARLHNYLVREYRNTDPN